MKQAKWLTALVVAATLAGGPAVYAAQSTMKDTPIDAVGDWISTLGKKSTEKDALIAQRKAARMAKRTQRAAAHQAKAVGNQMNQAGKHMKKSAQGLAN